MAIGLFSQKVDQRFKMICISIIARNNAEALEKMAAASPLADIIEIRLDVMERFDLEEIVESASKPILVTYRSRKEGGRGSADYGTRVRYLIHAIEAGADLVDVEFTMPLEFRQKVVQERGSCGFVVSVHLLNGTPSRERLEDIFANMAATGADIVKIIAVGNEAMVTWQAKNWSLLGGVREAK